MEAVHRFASQRVNKVLETRQSLEEQARRLDALVELGHINFDEPVPEEAARRVLLKILDVMAVEAGEVWVVDWEGDRVMMVTQNGLSPMEFREVSTFKMGEGIPGLVTATGRPVVTQELSDDTRFLRRGVVREGFRFIASVPLTASDTAVGVLSIASRRRQPWDEKRSGFLQAMGKLLDRRTLDLLLHEIRSQRDS